MHHEVELQVKCHEPDIHELESHHQEVIHTVSHFGISVEAIHEKDTLILCRVLETQIVIGTAIAR